MQRINFSQEERERYRKQRMAEFEASVNELVSTWEEKPEKLVEYLRFKNQFYKYSIRNTMLIYSQNPYAAFVGSFKRFKELGYNIKAGEHGMGIMAYTPIIFYRLKTDAAWHRLSGAPQSVRGMVEAGMIETREEPHFKVGTVFDISQTDCPLEDYPKLLGLGYSSEQHAAIYKVACDYSTNIGLPVTETDLKSVTLRGDYDPESHAIRINSILGDTQKLSTLLHEMAHGIMGHQVGEKSSAQRELEADLLSMMLCNRYGIEVTDARIDHMVNSFHAFTNEQKSVENPVQLVNLIESVNQLFERHESALQKAMEKAGILLQMEQAMTAAPQMSKTQEKENLPLQERQERRTVVVNLIAGPGAGKTTCAWEIAEKLKKQGYVAEYVSEVAKEYVWDERYDLLDGSFEHQKSLFDEQKHRIDRLIGKVDFVVTDSPLILSSVYLAEGTPAEKEQYRQMVRDAFSRYTNFTIFVERGNSFEREGRIHTEDESRKLDGEIKEMLRSSGVYYGTYRHDTIDVSISNMIKTRARLEQQAREPVTPNQMIGGDKRKQVQLAVAEIKSRLSIVDVIQRSVPLVKAGTDFKCCCPFHDEKTPSFVVHPKTNTFHCFGCGEKGDAIDFTQKFFNLDFLSAVAMIDSDFGLHILDAEIPESKVQKLENYQKRQSDERKRKDQQEQEYTALQDRAALLDQKLMAMHLTEKSSIQEMEEYFAVKSSYDAAVGELERLELLQYMERKGILSSRESTKTDEQNVNQMKIDVKAESLESTTVPAEGRTHVGNSIVTINESLSFPVRVMENQYGDRYIQLHKYGEKGYSYIVPRSKEIFAEWSRAVLSAYQSKVDVNTFGTKHENDMSITVRSVSLTEKGKIKAYAAVDVGDLLTINSIKVIEAANGQKYVALPSLAPVENEKGQKVYSPAVSVSNKNLESQINEQVLRKYQDKISERQEGKIMSGTSVKRFCEEREGQRVNFAAETSK